MRKKFFLVFVFLASGLFLASSSAQVKDAYGELKKKKEEEKKEDQTPLRKLFNKFLRNEEKKNTSGGGEKIYHHYYYDYYRTPPFYPSPTYVVPPPVEQKNITPEQIQNDVLLAYRSQDADLLMLYLSSHQPLFVEFPGADPIYLTREDFYRRTRALFEEIKTESVKALFSRFYEGGGLLKINHAYKRGSQFLSDDVAFFFQKSGESWFLDQIRYSFPKRRRAVKALPRSLGFVDMEKGRKSFLMSYRRTEDRKQWDASLQLGLFDYGGFFLRHWQLFELWDKSQPQLGDLKMTLMDFGFRGQFVKAQTHSFSVSLNLLGKWLAFTPPLAVRGKNPRVTSPGFGAGIAASIPFGKHFSLYGRLEGSSFTAGVFAVEYELGSQWHLNRQVGFLVSHRAFDFEEAVLASTRFGLEIHF